MDNTQAIKDAQAELNGDLLPTAPVGWTVQWYQAGNTEEPRAAIVTKVEAPGRVQLTQFSPMAFPKHEPGVWHESWPDHKTNPHNTTTQHHGSWGYPPGQKIPKEHYELHREQLEQRIKNLVESQARYDEAQAAREAREKAKQEQAAAV